MGKILTKWCACCCCCCSRKTPRNRVLPMQTAYKVLLLGLSGSGKTDLGCMLSGKWKRVDFTPTNGVQYFQRLITEAGLPATGGGGKLSITEIGGNEEMQKLWPQYYATTMGVIYCVDMSGGPSQLRKSFDTLTSLAGHRFVRGKPILLVATKMALMDASSRSGMQLYDIENAFQLDRLASVTTCPLRLCCYEGLAGGEQQGDTPALASSSSAATRSIDEGIKWLTTHLMDNHNELQLRVKCDANMQLWKARSEKMSEQTQLKKYYKYPTRPKNFGPLKLWSRPNRLRPQTAPSVIYHISTSSSSSHLNNNEVMTAAQEPPTPKLVPNSMELTDFPRQNGHAVAI